MNNKTMDIDLFLTLRRHLSIAHHVPGRVRLRIAASVRQDVAAVDRKLLDNVIGAIGGIQDVRVNAVAGSVVISYKADEIKPSWWDVLVNGKEGQATTLLEELMKTKLATAAAEYQST